MADPLTQARTYLALLVADRQRRGTHTAPEHLEAAAALLARTCVILELIVAR